MQEKLIILALKRCLLEPAASLVAHTLQDFCRGTLWGHRLSHYVFAVSQANRAAPPKIALLQMHFEPLKRGGWGSHEDGVSHLKLHLGRCRGTKECRGTLLLSRCSGPLRRQVTLTCLLLTCLAAASSMALHMTVGQIAQEKGPLLSCLRPLAHVAGCFSRGKKTLPNEATLEEH